MADGTTCPRAVLAKIAAKRKRAVIQQMGPTLVDWFGVSIRLPPGVRILAVGIAT
jgi:hypothetical protein